MEVARESESSGYDYLRMCGVTLRHVPKDYGADRRFHDKQDVNSAPTRYIPMTNRPSWSVIKSYCWYLLVSMPTLR